jgi:flagellar motor switch protein FliM
MPLVADGSEQVTPYDFRRPPWIARDRRAILEGAHQRMLPGLERILTAAVRTPATVTIRDVAQVSFSDWRRGLEAPLTAFVVPLADGEGGDGLLVLQPSLAHQLVDLALGGAGEPGERPAALTPLEQAILGQLMTDLVVGIRDGYREVAPFTPGALRFEEIVESLSIVDAHERLLLLECTVAAGALGGELVLALPAVRIDGFVRGTPGAMPAAPSPPDAVRQQVERQLRGASLPVTVRLSGFRLTAREGASLRVGQVLESNHVFQGNVELHINGRPRFLGALGRNQGHVGLRILERLDGALMPTRLLRRTSTP